MTTKIEDEGVPVLDRDAPYGEVYGGGKVRFVQNGVKFDFAGKVVEDDYVLDNPLVSSSDRRKAKEQAKADAKAARRAAFLKPSFVVQESPVEDKEPLVAEEVPEDDDDWAGEPADDGFDTLHWTKLRKLVEDAGGTYTGKDEAITWLRANA